MFVKHSFLLLSLLISLNLTAQTELIIPVQPDVYENMEATNFIFAKPTTIWSHYIDLQVSNINSTDIFNLRFHNENYNVTFDRKEERGINNYSWFGSNTSGYGNIIITVLGDDVQGIITKGNSIYRILTTAKLEKAIIKIDQSKYPAEDCFITGAEIPNGSQKQSPILNNEKGASHIKQALADGCTINGLVVYTPAAEAAMKGSGNEMLTDIKNAVQQAVDITNEAFEDSEITDYPPIELVLVQKLNFVEGTSTSVDLNAFKNNSFVNNLRDQYNADFCTLITDTVYGKTCGRGFVQATQSSVYNLVPYDCMIEQLSFAHEFGHLFGADHDVNSNPIDTTGDGHGYVYYTGRWRTIMAYNAAPCGIPFSEFCFRKPYYSNPDVRYPDDNQPMGTVASENNARVCRDYYQTIAQFQQPVNNFTLNNTVYNSSNSIYTNILAKQTITSSGSVIVPDSSTLILKAGQRVRLNNGFSSKSKANGHYGIESIEDCP